MATKRPKRRVKPRAKSVRKVSKPKVRKPKARKKPAARKKTTTRRSAAPAPASRGVLSAGALAALAASTPPAETAPTPQPSAPTITMQPLTGAAFTSVLAAAGLPVLSTAAVPPTLPPQPPGVELQQNVQWKNYGTNLSTQVGTVYKLTNGPANQAAVGLAATQWAVRHCAANAGSGCASGARWSFSPVAMTSTAMFDLRTMAKQLAFQPQNLHDPDEHPALVQVQGGTMVQQLITYAENAGRSLKAMGGNCGQTVAGAIATGTHGGFTGRPGFPDMVRALYVVGEDGRRHWIERPSKPVLSADTKAQYRAANVTVHDTDEAFMNHALVSLGTFGLVYSVTLETAPQYAVKFTRKPTNFDDVLDAETFDRDFGASPPLDFATVVNPYRMHAATGRWRGDGTGSAVRTRVDLAPAGTPAPPGASTSHPINDADLAPLLAGFANAVPGAVAPLTNVLLGSMYGEREISGPMSVAYPLSLTHSPTLGMELGVPADRAREVFGVMLDYIQTAATPLPGVIAIRQTPKSVATLSLARWDPTTTFELACLLVPGTEELLTGLLDQLDRQAIPFTLHLGMLYGRDAAGQSWLTRERFERMFGAAEVAAWRAARAVTCPTGRVFSNPLTRSLGLTS